MTELSTTTPIKIVVVEDNAGDLLLLQESIQMSDIPTSSICVAETLAEAIEALKRCQPDVVFLDLFLSDSSGIESFNQIREYVKRSAVIILSGLSDTKISREAIAHGAQDFLAKGEFDEKLLSKTVLYSLARKRAEISLLEAKERYDLVSKATHDLIWDWDLITGQVYRDESAVKDVYGFSSNDPIAHIDEWNKRIHPDDMELVVGMVEKIKNPGQQNSFHVEYRFLTETGECKYIYDRGYIVRDADGKPIRLIGAAQDITNRKLEEAARMKAEESMRQSEEKYRQLFYGNPFPMFLYDGATLRIIEGNNAALDKYGYTRDEFLKLTLNQIKVHPGVDFEHALPSSALKFDDSNGRIWTHRKKNGEEMIVEMFVSSIEFGGRKVKQVQINDITEKEKLAEALEESRQQQQRAITEATIQGQEKEREQLGIELHDNVNQILATAKLYLDFAMAEHPVKKEGIQKGKEFIIMATHEVRKLSHALLPPSLDEFGLVAALNDLIEPVSALGNFYIERQWNDFYETGLQKDHKLTIYRIVQEQLNNIIKHAEATRVRASLRQAEDGSAIELVITDDGKGFDPAQKRNGVGLRNIISRAGLLDGTVSINSKPGQGCELKVVFPGRHVPKKAYLSN